MSIRFLSVMFVFTSLALSQAITSLVGGTVTDTQKAPIPAASIQVVSPGTGQTFKATANAQGNWAIPSVPPGTYTVSVAHPGFKSQVVSGLKVNAGIPATVNVALPVGEMSQTVEVSSGGEVLQTQTATVTANVNAQEIQELPLMSRNANQLVAQLPGTQTGAAVRQSLISGLPQSTINQTLDGMSIQDNTFKSSDGIFDAVMPRIDMLQTTTLTTAAADASNTGDGAVQIQYVTKQGTNGWHGDLYEQNRNTALEANYFFNKAHGLPRGLINLNEFGGSLGGPIIQNKLFFFFAMEAFRIPIAFSPTNQEFLTPTAQTGVFTYKDSGGQVDTVDLYNLAAAQNASLPPGVRPFGTAADAAIAATLANIQKLVTASGLPIVSRITSNNDYNRDNYSWVPPSVNDRNFPVLRLDYNFNQNNSLEFVTNFQTNHRDPDQIAGSSAFLPGTGTVLGDPGLGTQNDDFFTDVAAWRSVLSPQLTNEVRFGIVGGDDWFALNLNPNAYTQWHGVVPNFSGYVTNPYTETAQSVSKRNTPIYTLADHLSWLRGNHVLTLGGEFNSVGLYQSSNGRNILPTVALSNLSTDPDNSGSTNLFTSTTLPGSSAQQRSDAAALYALLTGRVSSITSTASLSEATDTYGPTATITRDLQREFALFFVDHWQATPRLSLSYGLRWEKQLPFTNTDGFYTDPGLTGLYGISGVGNLFKPNTATGVTPVFNQVAAGASTYAATNKGFLPSFGFAYQLPNWGGWLAKLTGPGSVLRGGYSISSIREGMGVFTGALGGNPGPSLPTSVSPATTPSVFPAGSVYFSDATYPTLAPTSLDPSYPKAGYPIPVTSGENLSTIDPNLKMEYVQSWNLGWQRQIGANTALEFRYTGNHGTNLWRTINLNEVNIFENGFLSEFQTAQNNLALARTTNPTSNTFGGLPGQQPIPLIAAALGETNDQTTATQLTEGVAGAMAAGIANNAARMARVVAAGYPANTFVVNPATTGSVNLLTNGGSSTYNAFTLQLMHRLSKGLTAQGSYTFARSLNNIEDTPQTLRDGSLDKAPSFSDIRDAFKLNWIYQLPFGAGQHWLNSKRGFGQAALGNWQVAVESRFQSGVPMELGSGTGFATFNNNDPGVVLHNLTAKQLQGMMAVRIVGAPPNTIVDYLPQTLINNTLAAYAISGTLDPLAPYIGPPAAGQLGDRAYLYGPWFNIWDLSLSKGIPIGERMSLSIRGQALNLFNSVNFLLPTQGLGAVDTTNFGQTTNAFTDLKNTNDPGARVGEFIIRLTF